MDIQEDPPWCVFAQGGQTEPEDDRTLIQKLWSQFNQTNANTDRFFVCGSGTKEGLKTVQPVFGTNWFMLEAVNKTQQHGNWSFVASSVLNE